MTLVELNRQPGIGIAEPVIVVGAENAHVVRTGIRHSRGVMDGDVGRSQVLRQVPSLVRSEVDEDDGMVLQSHTDR